jgi:hypothetical protein
LAAGRIEGRSAGLTDVAAATTSGNLDGHDHGVSYDLQMPTAEFLMRIVPRLDAGALGAILSNPIVSAGKTAGELP